MAMKSSKKKKGRLGKRTTNDPQRRQDRILSRLNSKFIGPQLEVGNGKNNSKVLSNIISYFNHGS